MSEQLVQAIAEMKEEDAFKMVDDLIENGEPPMNILDDCTKAMEIVGKKFESGEYFLPHLLSNATHSWKIAGKVSFLLNHN